MKRIGVLSLTLLGLALACSTAQAQVSQGPPPESSAPPAPPSWLDWTPPALTQLGTLAVEKSSFTLDRNMLNGAAALLPDSEEQDRVIIRKLEGVSVHTMRFNNAGIPDEAAVESVRAAYHAHGWKHLMSSTNAHGPLHNSTTDLWVVMDGVTVRRAVILAETPRSLTQVSIACNLNPIDILHLRGHFGIPRFDGDNLREHQN